MMKAETTPRPTLELAAREIASQVLPYAQQTDGHHPLDRLMGLPEVMRITTFCRSSIYNKVRDGTMPAPLKLANSNRVAWRSSEIAAWLAGQPRTTPKRAA